MQLRRSDGQAIRYGVVTVLAKDGSVERQYKITAEQAVAWNAAGSWTEKSHVGVTRDEWESNRASMGGCTQDVGDYAVEADGTLMLKFGEYTSEAGLYVNRWLRLDAGEYSLRNGLAVDKAVLDSTAGHTIESIEGGTLVSKE